MKKLAAATVILTMLWLGGVACSSCCATGLADSCCAESHLNINAGVSCDNAAAEKSCCRIARDGGKRQPAKTSIAQLDLIGCSLLPHQIEALTSTEFAIAISTAAVKPPVSMPLLVSRQETKFLADGLPPRNRGGTYLRYGALLI